MNYCDIQSTVSKLSNITDYDVINDGPEIHLTDGEHSLLLGYYDDDWREMIYALNECEARFDKKWQD